MADDATMRARARKLRRQLTEAEQALWSKLRRRHVNGVRFLRQRPVGHFILDFYAPSLKLAVEVDGGQHFDEPGLAYDARRDAWLKARGIVLIRFSNRDVLQRQDAVLEEIERIVRCLQAHPPGAVRRPPSSRRG